MTEQAGSEQPGSEQPGSEQPGAEQPPRILLVDDEPLLRQALGEYLRKVGYDVTEASSRREAEEVLLRAGFDAGIFDYDLGDGNAHDLLTFRRRHELDIAIVILTGHATIDLAVSSLKQGAEHFLTKPVKMTALRVVLARVLENRRNRRHDALRKSHGPPRPFDPFLGTSAAIQRLQDVARRLAQSASPIRIHGETGTGKGVLARWLHDNGPRADEPFVDINCAGLSPEFLDSELFGHQRGAFTGAATTKVGLLEVAHRGTVFLDEIGDVDMRVQPKLLKVLEEKRFRRLGDVREREVSIRLVAASHQDLQELVRSGRFREDLYFRISTLPIEIPALRERREDVPTLAEDILTRLVTEMGRAAVLSPAAIERLKDYGWPGNIRELRNVLERALLLCGTREIRPDDFYFDAASAGIASSGSGITGSTAAGEVELTLQEVERRHIARILRDEDNMSAAARVLGISRTTLYQKVRSYGLQAS